MAASVHEVRDRVLRAEAQAPAHRAFAFDKIEVRELDDGQLLFTGHAAVFDSLSEDLGGFFECVRPRAFDAVLAKSPDVRFRNLDHKGWPLARTASKTMDLSPDERGLLVKARLAPIAASRELKILVERGDISQMSFSFSLQPDGEDDWHLDDDGRVIRSILAFGAIYDVSPVVFPAYAETDASMRSVELALRDLERRMEPKPYIWTSTGSGVATASMSSTGGSGLAAQVEDRSREDRLSKQRAYERCVQYVTTAAWAMHPATLAVAKAIITERAAGVRPSDEEVKERLELHEARAADEPQPDGSPVAVMDLFGPVFPRAQAMGLSSGGVSAEAFIEQFQAAVADPAVKAIVLNIDSPGGSVDLVPELGAAIYRARGTKPIVAVANTMAASAAYWIAAQADQIAVTPSGEVGSIGVYAIHDDLTEAQAKLGVKSSIISAGKYKTELHPLEPLDEEAEAEMQSKVDAYYGMFTRAVAKGRGVPVETVRSDFGQGRMVMAEKAVKVGMADRVATLDEVVAGLAAGTGSESPRRSLRARRLRAHQLFHAPIAARDA